MNSDRFDSIARKIASAGAQKGTRRALLRALGIAGGAAALGAGDACASPGSTGRPDLDRKQSGFGAFIEDLAFELEYDVEKIFRFVSDEIGYEPYEGALRGITGTLWSGAGNSVDQAILLKALLDASSVNVQFVAGPLPEAEATTLLEATAQSPTIPESARLFMEAENTAAAEVAAATTVATPAAPVEGAKLVAQLDALRSDLLAQATDRARKDLTKLSDVLAGAGVLVSGAAQELPPGEREQHVWLRMASGTEMIDLDPTFPDATVGDVFAQTAQDPSATLAEIPQDRHHLITLRVLVDTRSGDQVRTEPLLDYQVRSLDMVGQDMMLLHIEPESMEGIGFTISQAFEGTVVYYPVIVLGAESFIADQPMRFGSGGGILDDVFGEDTETGVANGEVVAEYLEIEVQSPGRDPVVTRRTVFDRIADQRGAESIDFERVAPIELVQIGEEEGYLPVKQITAMASVVGGVPDEYLNRPASDRDPFASFTGTVHAMHATRAALQRTMAEAPGLFIAVPNVSAVTLLPLPGDDGSLGARLDADLLVQGYGARGGDLHSALMHAGLLAQAAETLLLNQTLLETMYESGLSPVMPEVGLASASAIFDAAESGNIALLVLKPGEESRVEDLGLPRVAADRLREQVAAGRAVIVPETMVEIGGMSQVAWWVYDPATGAFFDQLGDGRSGATLLLGPFTEYLIDLWIFTKTLKGVFLLGACIFAVVQAVGSYLNLIDSPTAGNWLSYGGGAGAAALACGAYAGAGAL